MGGGGGGGGGGDIFRTSYCRTLLKYLLHDFATVLCSVGGGGQGI